MLVGSPGTRRRARRRWRNYNIYNCKRIREYAAVPAPGSRVPSPVQLAAGPGGCRRVGRLKDRLPTFAYTLNMQFLQYEIVLFTKLPEGSVSFAVWRPMAADPDVSSPEGSPISFAGLLCVHVHRVRGSLLLRLEPRRTRA